MKRYNIDPNGMEPFPCSDGKVVVYADIEPLIIEARKIVEKNCHRTYDCLVCDFSITCPVTHLKQVLMALDNQLDMSLYEK